MLNKIEKVFLTIVNATIAIGLMCGMGIAMTIMSIVDGTLFGVFIGIVLIVIGIFAFGMAQHDTVHEWANTFDEES